MKSLRETLGIDGKNLGLSEGSATKGRESAL